jgi:coniferyl-aldehyde dehydrogenase
MSTESTAESMLAQLQKQRDAFLNEGFVTYETRIDRLNRLETLMLENIDPLCAAMAEDFGHRSPHQSRVADFYGTLEAIKFNKQNLKKWMKNEKRKPPLALRLMGTKAHIQYQPKGVVGNITTWNFPVFVAAGPTAGILAAGNRCMVKLTEVTPRSSEMIKNLFSKYFDASELVGVTGGPEVGAAFSALPLDHILFTGATSVGRYVLQGAAKNLTPVTLELGGKSPVIIGRSADFKETALRIFTGKALNVGQVCISPDYIFVPEEKLEEFYGHAEAHIKTMFPTMLNNPDYTSVVNARHQQRINSYIEDARNKGGDVREINPLGENFSQQKNTFKIPMTIVVNPTDDMKVMQEEIFGPVISLKTYKKVDECIRYINAHPRPLALYYFGNDKHEQNHVLENTTSGGAVVNDVLAHAGLEDAPFGGIGPSGMGNYHGHEGFKTFSHAKTVMTQSRINMMKLTGMIPPYNKKTDQSLEFMLKKSK